MSLKEFFRANIINEGVDEFRRTPGAYLFDVRDEIAYKSGHIPGSINIPMDRIATVLNGVPNKATPLYLYCDTGNKSANAVIYLKDAGYLSAVNIGGLTDYVGDLER